MHDANAVIVDGKMRKRGAKLLSVQYTDYSNADVVQASGELEWKKSTSNGYASALCREHVGL